MNPVRFTIPALLTAMLLPLTACEDQKRTETRSYDLSSAVTAMAVHSFGGRITVTAAAGGTIHVTETLRYTGARPAPEYRLDAGQLTFTSGCQGHQGDCGVDYRIEVPAGVHTTMDSAGGAIAVDGLAGRLDLSSGGGTIDATRIASASLTARTGGGASVLDFAVPPGAVRTDSAGGDVTVRLPAERYAVDARSDGGDTRIEVTVDPAASHRIDVRAGGGDILVAPAVR
ncbi:hypothetical protein [Actinoplanes regularis]|uniref:Adhesin n=1 Tax=Actinoplanes regularis TaxID=52697 RepID=A0A238YPD1_9ACTN|nr:hypothetical protein [Actinoplanes regularis]GIE85414.1 hypothetical protein Are01nite_18940 [Actinoplanes regularis]SNR72453.1 hypothetical protein SAMN06264365_10536 [Actinoplanes regularis]